MPKDHIAVDTTSLYGGRLRNLKDRVRETLAEAEYLRDVAAHMIADPDYSDVEGTNGFGVGTGNGATTYNVLASVASQLNHSDVQTLIHRFG